MKTKEDIIINLIRENKITNEEAKILLEKDQTVQWVPYNPYPNWWEYPTKVTCLSDIPQVSYATDMRFTGDLNDN